VHKESARIEIYRSAKSWFNARGMAREINYRAALMVALMLAQMHWTLPPDITSNVSTLLVPGMGVRGGGWGVAGRPKELLGANTLHADQKKVVRALPA
jgi:hypothetical protein